MANEDAYKKLGKTAPKTNKKSYDKLNKEGSRAKELKQILKTNVSITHELEKQIKAEEGIDAFINKRFKMDKVALAQKQRIKDLSEDDSDKNRKKVEMGARALAMQNKMVSGVKQQLSGMKGLVTGARTFLTLIVMNPIFALAAVIIAIGAAFFKFQKAVAETRKNLGISAIEAGKLELRFAKLGFMGKAFGLETQDMRDSFEAIRKNFGGINQATDGFVYNLARASLETGATAEQMSKVLAIQESVSDASRSMLLSQMRAEAATIRLAGIAPGAVFQDLAENAEFFATHMKDGGKNVMKTATQAAKLGMNLGTVTKITESLLDFESSIEKQMEASMLLGRQINLDKARQLAFMDDQEGMMAEIIKQAGGEAEFERMKGFQRKTLADAFGVSVEELSRFARKQETGAQAAEMKSPVEQTLDVATKSLNVLFDIRDDTSKQVQESKKQTVELQN